MAQYNFGLMFEYGHGVKQDYSTAKKWYTKAAEQGFAQAQCSLGIMYHHGRGVDKSIQTAVDWYKKAADRGDANASFNLSVLDQDSDEEDSEDENRGTDKTMQ